MNLTFAIAYGGPLFVCFVGLGIVLYWDKRDRKNEANRGEKK